MRHSHPCTRRYPTLWPPTPPKAPFGPQRSAERAQRAVAVALREGRMEVLACEVCGSSTDVKAHHADYSEPLDVQWLCAIHTPGRQ
jgi:hypothetical protein